MNNLTNLKHEQNTQLSNKKHSSLLYVICSLLLVICFTACFLFSGPEVDLFQIINDEVDWANAEKLTVTVAYPGEWGRSPQEGIAKCGDTRKGYEFGVEFTPLSGYGFEKWLAFKTADYAALDMTKNASEVEVSSLNNNIVTITETTNDTGAKTAKVKINTSEPVTLVPWCDSRPRLAPQTNPPLNPIITPFPFSQTVNIWFTMPVKASTLIWNNIRITGVYNSGSDRGQLFNGDGDLTEYFNIEIPPGSNNRLSLIPKTETAPDLALLSINVTVGPGIENFNGIPMAQAETISYQTDTREAQKVYRAGGVSASRNADSNYFTDTDWGNANKDRRFRQTNKNTVYIRFSIEAPSGENIPQMPDKIRIFENRAYNLRGYNASGRREKDYDCPGAGVTLLPSGEIRIEHTLMTGDADFVSGIIQLVVLPFNEGEPAIPRMAENEALSEGRYVTVVMDNAAPNVNEWPVLSAPSSKNGDIYVYGKNVSMTLTLAGLAEIADNGDEGGISVSRAYGLPWTMDEPQKLFWYARLGTDTQTGKKESGQIGVYEADEVTLKNKWTLTNLVGLTEGEAYPVYVRYEDSLGNLSAWKDTLLKVMYSNATIETVSNIRAECSTAGNQITVRWDEPSGWTSTLTTYPYPEVVITTCYASAAGDIEESTSTYRQSRNTKNYSFTTPKITDNGVRDGIAVSGVYGYKINVITHNIAGDATVGPIWIYNIPEMKTAETAITKEGKKYLPVRKITSANMSELTVTGSENINYVLTKDITLTSVWTSIGTGSGASAFQGKFYGNGHTITINSINALSYTGLFGYVNDALIRDLKIVCNNITISANTTIQYLGGIAAYAGGSTQITNIITSGSLKTGILSYNYAKHLGGVIGYMDGSSEITNSRAGMDFDCTTASISSMQNNGNDYEEKYFVNFGGLCGYTSSTGTITSVNSTGNLNFIHTKEFDYSNVGGVVGIINRKYGRTFTDIEFSGTLKVSRNVEARKRDRIGGIAGIVFCHDEYVPGVDTLIFTNCRVSGSIETGMYQSQMRLGGLIGEASYTTIIDSRVSGDIKCNTSGGILIGGVLGSSSRGNYTNVWYERGSITATGVGTIYMGGVVSMINNSASDKYNNCYSFASIISVSSSGQVIVGGFAAICRDINLSRCYAKSDVRGESSGAVYAGGLIGRIEPAGGNADITECYTSGNVTAISYSDQAYAGGLIGDFFGYSGDIYTAKNTLKHNYALGNVNAETNSTYSAHGAYAGGLVGCVDNNINCSIQYCFAKGNVSAKSSGSTNVYAGGLVGSMSPDTASSTTVLQYNAVISANVTAMGYSNSSIGDGVVGRICSYVRSTTSLNNNYARSNMYLGKAIYTNNPYPAFTPVPVTAGLTTKHGADAAYFHFFDNDYSINNGIEITNSIWRKLGFNTQTVDGVRIWDSSYISLGYPKLVRTGGQQ